MGKLWDRLEELGDTLEAMDENDSSEDRWQAIQNMTTYVETVLNEWTGKSPTPNEDTWDLFRLACYSLCAVLTPAMIKMPREEGKILLDQIKQHTYAILSVAYNLGISEADPNAGLEEVYRQFLGSDLKDQTQ